MNLIKTALVGMVVVVLSSFAHAELDLRPIHPDEPVEHTYNKRFSLDEAAKDLVRVRTYLESFRLLTGEVRGKVPERRLKEIGNTDRETQGLGFSNMLLGIEGTLRKQDYMIKKLQYELAVKGSKNGRTGESELRRAKKAFEDSERSFQKFWDKSGIAD